MPAERNASTISGQISSCRLLYSSSYPGLTSRTHAYCAIRSPPLIPSDLEELQGQQACDLAQRADVVTYAEGAVVRRALLAPGVHERGWRQRELESAVCVPDPQRRSWQRLALGGEHFEPTFAGLGNAEDGNGPGPDAELDRDPVAGLPMVDTQAPQHRLAVADGNVPWTIVAHQYEAFVEVHRVELRERSAGS